MYLLKKFLLLILISFILIKPALSNDKVAFLDINFLVENSIFGKKILKELKVLDDQNISKLKLLEKKKLVKRKLLIDNRKKNIELLKEGSEMFDKIYPLIVQEEYRLFNKLNNEIFNFTNSLKLVLGKKIRIKAKKINEI